MDQACPVCAPMLRSRLAVVLAALVVTTAPLRPVAADDSGFVLGLGGRTSEPAAIGAASLIPSPAHLGLGVDPHALAPAPPPDDAPSDVPDDAALAPGTQGPTVPSLAAFPRRVWRDFGVLVTRPLAFDSSDWTHLALGVGLVGVVAGFDNRLRNTVQAHSTASSRNFANRIRPIGTWGGLATMGLLLGVGELANNASMASTGADGIEASLFAAGLVTPALQEFAGRQRPRTGQGDREFEPVSSASSFPSGEATEAFTLAAVVARHTTSPVLRGVAWGLAGLVGWERMQLDAHWASDIAAGALIGATVGSWVSDHNRSDGDSEHRIALQPVVGPGVVGLNGSASW